jgi:stage V sporulation protein AC
MNAGHAADTMDKRVREWIRMNMSPKEYNRYVARLAKKSPLGKDLLNSFLIGGLICVIGQLILNGYTALELSEQDAAAATSVSLVFLSAVLTGLSVYDDLAKIAGAGTLVPITGFANAVVSPAIEFKAEVRCIIGIVRENRNR